MTTPLCEQYDTLAKKFGISRLSLQRVAPIYNVMERRGSVVD